MLSTAYSTILSKSMGRVNCYEHALLPFDRPYNTIIEEMSTVHFMSMHFFFHSNGYDA